MLNKLKAILRDLLPGRAQVPVKYWFDWVRGYLEDEMMLLDMLVSRGDRVIDVGGNRGVYGYSLKRLGAEVEIFEPNPVCLAVLEAWAANEPSVGIHGVALSSRNGSANLHIPVDEFGVEHDASASVEHDGFSKKRDQLVALKTLDSFGSIDVSLIKIDVEGHECSVIEGALVTIKKARPALLVEIEQRHLARPIEGIFETIRQLGYRGFFLIDGALLPIEKFNCERHQQADARGRWKAQYINNFLFLNKQRCRAGDYKKLFDRYALR